MSEDKSKTRKAEYPLNSRGFGYRSTLENGPYFKEDVGFVEPLENYNYQFCGACVFYEGGICEALEEAIPKLASCALYISMAQELDLLHQQFVLQSVNKSEKSEVVEKVQKYIAEENGEYCVRSHQTGKSFGCYKSKAQAEKRLRQIQRFKDEDVPDEAKSTEIEVKFAAMDEDKRLVYGVVLEADEVDSQDDTITAEEIEKAAHKFLRTSRVIGEGHTKKLKAFPVESFIYDPEVLENVKKGSWVLVVKVASDSVWEEIKRGDLTGYSIGAMCSRQAILEEDE